MGLEPILRRIEAAASGRRDEQQAENDRLIAQIRQQGETEAVRLHGEILDRVKKRLAAERQRQLVQARLESRKAILAAKQQLIDSLFAEIRATIDDGRLKKQRVEPDGVSEVAEDLDFFLARVRQDCETEIAASLFS